MALRTNERGWSGTKLRGGRITGEDPNKDLQGKEWAETAHKMLYEDDAVAASWEAVSSTLLSARWAWEPGDSANPLSVKLADDANDMMGLAGRAGRMARSWEDILAELIMHEYLGFRYAEPIWRYRFGYGVDLVDIADRDPRAHHQWLIDGPTFLGVRQEAMTLDTGEMGRLAQKSGTQSPSGLPTIPADQLILLTRGGSGQNYEGRGLSRGAYFLWRLKTHVLDMISVASERWAFSTPLLVGDRAGATAAGATDPEFTAQLEQARTALEKYMTQEAAYLEGTPFVDFREYGGNLDASPMLSVIQHCDMGILRCFLVQFLALGISDTGARSVGEVHETFFRRAAVNVLDRVAAAMMGRRRPGGGVIGRWVYFNYGEAVDPSLYPRLTHSGLNVDRLLEIVPMLPQPYDAATINALRSRANLPALEQ